MGFIAKDENQLTLFYHPEGYLGMQVLPYAKSSEKDIRVVDLSKEKLTGPQWLEIAEGLGVNIQDLVNTEHAKFKAAYTTENPKLDEQDWISVLRNEPQTVRYPILIDGKKFYWIDKVFRFTEIMEVDSAGIEKPYPDPQKK